MGTRSTNKQIIARLEVLKKHFNKYSSGTCTRSNDNIIKDLSVLGPHINTYTNRQLSGDLSRLEELGYIKRINNGRKTKAKITKTKKFQYSFKESRTIYFLSDTAISKYPNGIQSCYNHTQYYKYKYSKSNGDDNIGLYNISSPDNKFISMIGPANRGILKEINYWCRMFKKLYPKIQQHIDLVPLNITVDKLIKKSNIDLTRYIAPDYITYAETKQEWILGEDHTLVRPV